MKQKSTKQIRLKKSASTTGSIVTDSPSRSEAKFDDGLHAQLVADGMTIDVCARRITCGKATRLHANSALPPEVHPPQELIDQACDFLAEEELGYFAADLQVARAMFRQHPTLVKARDISADLKKALVKEYGDLAFPKFRYSGLTNMAEARKREMSTNREGVMELARQWMQKGRAA